MTLKKLWISFIISFFMTFTFRSYQVLFLMDSNSVFLNRGTGITTYILLLIILAGFLVTFYLTEKQEPFPEKLPRKKSPLQGSFMTLAGILMAASEISTIFTYGVSSFFDSLIAFLGILASAVLIVFSFAHFSGKDILKDFNPIFTIVPIYLSVKVVFLTFINYTNIINISENLLHILSILSLIVFWFTYSKLTSDIISEKTLKRSLSVGFLSISICTSYSVPTVITKLINGTDMTLGDILSYAIFFTFALLILSYCLELTFFYRSFVLDKNLYPDDVYKELPGGSIQLEDRESSGEILKLEETTTANPDDINYILTKTVSITPDSKNNDVDVNTNAAEFSDIDRLLSDSDSVDKPQEENSVEDLDDDLKNYLKNNNISLSSDFNFTSEAPASDSENTVSKNSKFESKFLGKKDFSFDFNSGTTYEPAQKTQQNNSFKKPSEPTIEDLEDFPTGKQSKPDSAYQAVNTDADKRDSAKISDNNITFSDDDFKVKEEKNMTDQQIDDLLNDILNDSF